MDDKEKLYSFRRGDEVAKVLDVFREEGIEATLEETDDVLLDGTKARMIRLKKSLKT